MNDRKPFTRGRMRDIVAWFYDGNQGKDVTIDQLEKAFKGRYERGQIRATMAHLLGPKGGGLPFTRVTNGVWRLNEHTTAAPAEPEVEKVPMIEVEDKVCDGVHVKARDGQLYVEGKPVDLDAFLTAVHLGLRIS